MAEHSLLCVANFPVGTGYAWDHFETLYLGVARALAKQGVRTFIAYPSSATPPRSLADSPAESVELNALLSGLRSLGPVLRFIRKRKVRVIYFTDRPAWHPFYPMLRLAGVRFILVYDQTSGARTPPGPLKRLIKRSMRQVPGTLADRVLTVSDYVARRHIEVGMVPPRLVTRLWNGIDSPEPDPEARRRVHDEFGIAYERLIVICACRAAPGKGVHHLLRAFSRLIADGSSQPTPVLVYVAAGPERA